MHLNEINLKSYNSISMISFQIQQKTGPILESKACVQLFRKEAKGQNIWHFGQKCAKFENFLTKGTLTCAIIVRMKQLEYALQGPRGHPQ